LGVITGYFADASTGTQRGFVRDGYGVIKVFDPAGSRGTFATSINDQGAITGYFYGASFTPLGFVRQP
jgi:hypothetical protein